MHTCTATLLALGHLGKTVVHNVVQAVCTTAIAVPLQL